MKRTLIPSLVLSLLLCACGTESAAPTPPAAADDCTLATPLVPGIPGSPGHLIPSPRNPNGDSELAVLMRRFVDDLHEARPLLEAKKPVPKLWPAHRRMRCSWPTKPEERNERFDGMAVSYLAMVKRYDEAPGQATYNGIIDGCIACHSQSCGGPIPFIEDMRWK